ncbi:MAG: YjbQ family protein [Bacteroidales bacterium]|nr:YjbQ family protein [Bacteroidales bacterium]
MISQKTILLPPMSKGYHLITRHITGILKDLPDAGLLHVFLQHTSAALTINENADPSVRVDFQNFMEYLIPEGHASFTHVMEGLDDMPAHLKSSVFGPELTIPITDGKLNLGTWQGIYLCEFRNRGGSRRVILTIYS